MTEQEAIEIIKCAKAEVEWNCPLDYAVAFDMAIKAMKKQIPKKPKMRHIKHFDGYNDGWCPCCESYVEETDYDVFFCSECGQKLLWEGEEE